MRDWLLVGRRLRLKSGDQGLGLQEAAVTDRQHFLKLQCGVCESVPTRSRSLHQLTANQWKGQSGALIPVFLLGVYKPFTAQCVEVGHWMSNVLALGVFPILHVFEV